MKIAVIGSGYVGLVTAACFAETGNHVVCVDKDLQRIDQLRQGKLPIYELGLDDLVRHNLQVGRLTFTTDLGQAVRQSELAFITVGTPPKADGSADLSAVYAVAEELAKAIDHDLIVVIKSTVPVGTTRAVKDYIAARTHQSFEVASNPEFLREGMAIEDFSKPDRVVVGVENAQVGQILNELYSPFLRAGNPFIVTDLQTSELIKYVSNCMLAAKISFINEMANLCEILGADVDNMRRGVCADKRIGMAFMFPGIGYGGSCLPKDVPALVRMGDEAGYDCRMLRAVHEVNEFQPRRMFTRIKSFFNGKLAGRTGTVWGTAYKAGTNDVRFSPSIAIIEMLLKEGTAIRVHDPHAAASTRTVLGDRVTYCDDCYDALDNSEFLLVATDWREYRSPDFNTIKAKLKTPLILDGRNIYEPSRIRNCGFAYFGVGRV